MSFLIYRFTDKDLKDLFHVLDAAAAVDGSAAVVLSDHHHHHHYHHQQQMQQQNYYGGGSGYGQQQLTRLQDEILQCLETLERETLLFDDDEPGNGTTSASPATNCEPPTSEKTDSFMTSEQRQLQRQQLVQRFLCPLFDQLLKFCRFVCPPPPPGAQLTSSGDRQLLTNGGSAVDHFHHHNKVCVKIVFCFLPIG